VHSVDRHAAWGAVDETVPAVQRLVDSFDRASEADFQKRSRQGNHGHAVKLRKMCATIDVLETCAPTTIRVSKNIQIAESFRTQFWEIDISRPPVPSEIEVIYKGDKGTTSRVFAELSRQSAGTHFAAIQVCSLNPSTGRSRALRARKLEVKSHKSKVRSCQLIELLTFDF